MLSLQIRLSDRQFNTLLALYFEQWEYSTTLTTGKKSYRLNKPMEDNLFIATYRALESHGLIEHDDADEYGTRITAKGKKLCEAVCIEIREWSQRIAALERKTKRKVG